jgi:hypothetical protein
MNMWDDVKTEIQSIPILKEKLPNEMSAALEELLECYYINVKPFKELDVNDWARIKEKIRIAEADLADRRKGDRRKLCPHENMSKETWLGLCEVKEFMKPRSQGRRSQDLQTLDKDLT